MGISRSWQDLGTSVIWIGCDLAWYVSLLSFAVLYPRDTSLGQLVAVGSHIPSIPLGFGGATVFFRLTCPLHTLEVSARSVD